MLWLFDFTLISSIFVISLSNLPLISAHYIFFNTCPDYIALPGFFLLYIILCFFFSRADSCFEKTYGMKSAVIFTNPIYCFGFIIILLFSCLIFSAAKFLCFSILSLSLLNCIGDLRRKQLGGVDRCIGDTLASTMHSSSSRTIVVPGSFLAKSNEIFSEGKANTTPGPLPPKKTTTTTKKQNQKISNNNKKQQTNKTKQTKQTNK